MKTVGKPFSRARRRSIRTKAFYRKQTELKDI